MVSSGGGGSSGSGGGGVDPGNFQGVGNAADVARKLGLPAHFLIGLGNDLGDTRNQDAIYSLGASLNLHYAYLVGLSGDNGWPDWNPNGGFVDDIANSSREHGVVPMFTLYTFATTTAGEGVIGVVNDATFMGRYYADLKLLYQRLAAFDDPAVLHLEPDFWAYAQQQSGGNAAAIPAQVGSVVSECNDLPANLTGVGKCFVRLGRQIAPKTVIGFHASVWAGETSQTVAFLNSLGASEADIVVVETLDRDAGCFEAGTLPQCQRGGEFYWDESNTKSPNFHEHLSYAAQISSGVGLPLLWWQTPLGVPSDTPGGSPGHYRDNRVHYMFNHIDEFVQAGGLGVAFGVGAGDQTFIGTDMGQFNTAVVGYYANPVALP